MAFNIGFYAYAIIGHVQADQLLPQLLMEQFDTFPMQCRHIKHMHEGVCSALDKLLGQLGTYATWLSSIAYLQKQLDIFIFFYATFFSSVFTRFLIA